MQLVGDRRFPRQSEPALVPPVERSGIYDLTRSMHTIRLKTRGGIRDKELMIDHKVVIRANLRLIADGMKPALLIGFHLNQNLANAGMQAELDISCRRCP